MNTTMRKALEAALYDAELAAESAETASDAAGSAQDAAAEAMSAAEYARDAAEKVTGMLQGLLDAPTAVKPLDAAIAANRALLAFTIAAIENGRDEAHELAAFHTATEWFLCQCSCVTSHNVFEG